MSELQKIEVSEGGESTKPMMGGEGDVFEKTINATGGRRRRRRGGGPIIKPLIGGNAPSHSKTVGGKRKSKNGGKSRRRRKSRSRSRSRK